MSHHEETSHQPSFHAPVPADGHDSDKDSAAKRPLEFLGKDNLRFGATRSAAWLDLDREHCAVIRDDGWSVEASPTWGFRRGLQRPLPIPERGGDLTTLAPLIGIPADSNDFLLVCAWMVAVLLVRFPVPILLATGPGVCGKSWSIRALRSLLDPVDSPLLALRAEKLEQTLQSHAVPAFDQVGALRKDLSDELCRIVTAGCEPHGRHVGMLMSAASMPSVTQEFRDRTLVIELSRLDRHTPESQLTRQLEAARPHLLGALLDLAVAAMREDGAADSHYRFPGYSAVGRAVAGVLRGDRDAFDRVMEQKLRDHAGDFRDEDPLYELLLRLVREKNSFTGGSRELRKALEKRGATGAIPRNLGPHLQRIAPDLRRLGIEIIQHARKSNERPWEVRKTNMTRE